MTEICEASIELDLSGDEPRIWLELPRNSFTMQQLRGLAEYLATVADENTPTRPEVEDLAAVLACGVSVREDHRATARIILADGWGRLTP